MNVVIMNHTAMDCSYINTDVSILYQLLCEKYDCYVYASTERNLLAMSIDKDRMEELIQRKDTVVIYYHSTYWGEGIQILKQVKGKIIFRYFHIASPESTEPYSSSYVLQCYKGQKQTIEFVENFKNAYWVADSHFSLEDLNEVSEDRKAVCPIFNKADNLAGTKPEEVIMRNLLESGEVNVLFAGEMPPNKNHLKALNILRTYAINYGKKIKLRFIGKRNTGLNKYNESIVNFLDDFNLTETTEFIEEANDSELLSYYLASDLLLCVSEYGDACVSIAEAQYFGLPVITLNAGAPRETVGENQVVLEDDVTSFAAAIHVIFHNIEYQKYLIQKGRDNYYNRFSYEKISSLFISDFLKGIGEVV